MTTMQMILIVVGVILTGSVSWVLGAAWCGHFTRLRFMERKCFIDYDTEVVNEKTRMGVFQTGCGKTYVVVKDPESQTYDLAFCPGCGAMTVPKTLEVGREYQRT